MAIPLVLLPAKMESFGRQVVAGSHRLLKEAAVAATRAAALATPQDTGLHASNWRVGTGSAPTGVIPAYYPGKRLGVGSPANPEAAVRAASLAVATAPEGSTLVLGNNAPAIELLNAGSSSQAPAGFIEAAVNAAINAVRRGRVID